MTTNVNSRVNKSRGLKLRPFMLILFMSLAAVMMAQTATDKGMGILKFETDVIDYGTIAENSDGVRNFIFKNVGTAPIMIVDVKTSCGCTVPTKPKKPVLPGETAEIGVKYATNRIGAFSKTITVISNASENTKILKIKGKVEKGKTNPL